MNTLIRTDTPTVPHVVRGTIVTGDNEDYGRFRTPELVLDDLVWPRTEAPPAADTPLAEILDILVALGDWINRDPDGYIGDAFRASLPLATLEEGVLRRSYARMGDIFGRESLEFQIEQELGGADVLDGWREIVAPSGRVSRIRAFPPRLVHVVAGNAAVVTAQTVLRGAITKGVHLIKLPSNDLFTASAVLRGLSAVAPGHALARSFSAAYWRGGDRRVESVLYRPQFFDKLVAWGGEATIRSAKDYIGPAFELVAFDPKTSISLIGREAHAAPAVRDEVAALAAADSTVFDQQACVASRFHFVEGSRDEVDAYADALQRQLGVERLFASACGRPVGGTLREEIEALRWLDDDYRVFGGFDGQGLVIRSDEPVGFHPDGKIVNVVRVDDLADAVRHANVATQTVGVYPAQRRTELRNRLAAQGVQRVVAIGSAAKVDPGLPHDGFLPLQRFIRWVNDED